ncbi:MAG TPA: NAD(P)/FAD-dependent oxidoreductase, partial [Polyangia bacterium]
RWRALVSPPPRRLAEVARPSAGLLRTAAAGLSPAARVARRRFATEEARALWAGLAAHGMQPLDRVGTGGFALSLGAAAHAVGWPFARGGAQRLADALAGILRGYGGTIETGHEVRSLDELPAARAVLLDVSPEALARIAGDLLPGHFRDQLARFGRGSAAFKLDYALSEPIPWSADACRRAGVVHAGGAYREVAQAFDEVARGEHPARPFVLVAQPSLFDRGRVPSGSSHHTAWAYCPVPEGSGRDMTAPLEAQIERFAPGFRDVVLARHTLGPRQLEAHDANLVGGDIWGGSCDLRHLIFRPAPRLRPWTTPNPRIFLCSASTPPGPGVHGLCGFFAARAALRALRRRGF